MKNKLGLALFVTTYLIKYTIPQSTCNAGENATVTSQCCPDQAMIYDVSFNQSTNTIVISVIDSEIMDCSGLRGYEVELKCSQGETSFRRTQFHESPHNPSRNNITRISISLSSLDYDRNMINNLKCAIRIRGQKVRTSFSLTKENHLYLDDLTGFNLNLSKGTCYNISLSSCAGPDPIAPNPQLLFYLACDPANTSSCADGMILSLAPMDLSESEHGVHLEFEDTGSDSLNVVKLCINETANIHHLLQWCMIVTPESVCINESDWCQVRSQQMVSFLNMRIGPDVINAVGAEKFSMVTLTTCMVMASLFGR